MKTLLAVVLLTMSSFSFAQGGGSGGSGSTGSTSGTPNIPCQVSEGKWETMPITQCTTHPWMQ